METKNLSTKLLNKGGYLIITDKELLKVIEVPKEYGKAAL